MTLNKSSMLAARLLLLPLGLISSCRRQTGDLAEGQTTASISVSSSSFANDGRIPQKITCDGAGLSPDIQLPSPPAGTKSFLLVMDDPDASGFVHWLLYNIPSSTRDIPEGAASHGALPAGAEEGENSLRNTGYFGPCPPPPEPHHYIFRVYALDTSLNLPSGETKRQLGDAVKGHVLAEGSMTGLYARASR